MVRKRLAHWRSFGRHPVVQNLLALSASQVATYLFPLITIPYLARVLGVTGWGLVAFAQAFGVYLGIVVEYGFSLSAAREVARNLNDSRKLADLTAGVLGAKLLIAAASIAVAYAVGRLLPIFRTHPLLLWAGTFYGLAPAFSIFWFFQGLERMKLVASLDFLSRVLATVGIFTLVRVPQDAWKVLVLQGGGATVAVVAGTWIAYRYVEFRLPGPSTVWSALRMGRTMLLYKAALNLYAAGNAFILGLFVPPEFVGFYAGAEKISKAAISLLSPIARTLFPRLSRLISESRDQAVRLARISFAVSGIGGAAGGVIIFTFAPLIIRVILGHAYAPAVPVLRILAALPFLVSVGGVFGVQWMLPLGLDRAFNTIILAAGVLNIALAVLLASTMKAIGMACAVVASEAFVTLAMYLFLRARGLDFLKNSPLTLGKAGAARSGE